MLSVAKLVAAVRVGSHFTFTNQPLYGVSPVSTGYGDKLRRAIDAADPGAVPGGSTIITLVRDFPKAGALLSQG